MRDFHLTGAVGLEDSLEICKEKLKSIPTQALWYTEVVRSNIVRSSYFLRPTRVFSSISNLLTAPRKGVVFSFAGDDIVYADTGYSSWTAEEESYEYDYADEEFQTYDVGPTDDYGEAGEDAEASPAPSVQPRVHISGAFYETTASSRPLANKLGQTRQDTDDDEDGDEYDDDEQGDDAEEEEPEVPVVTVTDTRREKLKWQSAPKSPIPPVVLQKSILRKLSGPSVTFADSPSSASSTSSTSSTSVLQGADPLGPRRLTRKKAADPTPPAEEVAMEVVNPSEWN
jgi:hypothetical protein